MTLGTAITRAKRLARTNKASHTDFYVMSLINDALKEFGRNSGNYYKEAYLALAPAFDVQTHFAIRLTITGGTNALAETDIVICTTSALDQTGTQVAAALQTAIRAAGPTTLTVAWSTTEWTFTIDAIDATSITIEPPDTIVYADATTLLGFTEGTTVASSVTSSIPEDCAIETALPTDFLSLATDPYWDDLPLKNAPLEYFKHPKSSGNPSWYRIVNKRIRLYPVPTEQKMLHIWYKNIPTQFTNACGYQECGLSGKAPTAATGLTASTAYTYRVNIDGGGLVQYSITTGTSVTFEDVIDLINDQSKGATAALVDGDLRFTSDSLGSASAIALAEPASGTSLWATLTGFSAFDTAVASQTGTEIDVDDEYAMAVVYYAAQAMAEENWDREVADRYFAQFKRIIASFKMHRANNNPSVFPNTVVENPNPKVIYGG